MCSVYRQFNIYLQKYLQICLKDVLPPNENERNHWGTRNDCVFSQMESADACCPVVGRTDQVMTQTRA